jgi:TolB protein
VIRWAAIAVFALLMGSIRYGAAPARAAFPGANGRILYTDLAGTDYDILSVQPDGTDLVNLSHTAGFDGGARWSPDGTRIVFFSDRDGLPAIYTMNADGTNQKKAPIGLPGQKMGSPSWSPDGKRIVFQSRTSGVLDPPDIYVVNVDGSGLRNITNSSAWDESPVWSPDGSKIAFDSNATGPYNIYTMNPDGSGMTNLTSRNATDTSPNWSPDGATLAFTSYAPPTSSNDIWTVNANGTNLVQRTTIGGYSPPGWSPDGRFILSGRLRNGPSNPPQFVTMNREGGDELPLSGITLSPNGITAGDWQPLTCTVANVVDGDSFDCTDGRHVDMLQIDAPELDACGGDWAKAALQYIFLTPGRVVRLQYDTRTRRYQKGDSGPPPKVNSDLAAPIWIGNDGASYNLSIIMAYVGLAKAATIGSGNTRFLQWATDSENYARVAQWNMWGPGKPFNGGC